MRYVLSLVVLTLVGCNSSASEKRAEVKSISMAIDRLRQAPNAEKAPKLTELSKLPCSMRDTCELRAQCVAAYALHVEALDEIAAGKGKLDGEQVQQIEQKLEAARKQVHECLERELVVGRRFGTQI
jgi:hypothetical protein